MYLYEIVIQNKKISVLIVIAFKMTRFDDVVDVNRMM